MRENKHIKTVVISKIYVYFTVIPLFLFSYLCAFFVSLLDERLAYLLFGIACLFIAFQAINLFSFKYIFHEYSLFIEKGFFTKKKDIVEFFRIVDIREKQPFFLRPLNLTIYYLYTNDLNNKIVVIKAVKKDDDFFFMNLRNLINESRKKYRLLEML